MSVWSNESSHWCVDGPRHATAHFRDTAHRHAAGAGVLLRAGIAAKVAQAAVTPRLKGQGALGRVLRRLGRSSKRDSGAAPYISAHVRSDTHLAADAGASNVRCKTPYGWLMASFTASRAILVSVSQRQKPLFFCTGALVRRAPRACTRSSAFSAGRFQTSD